MRFLKTIEREAKNESDGNDKTESMRVISPFWLFNLDQIDGIDKPQATAQLSEFQQIEAAENVLKHSGAMIREEGEVDMSERVRSPHAGVFAALTYPDVFAQVHVEFGAVTWPGELDLAPDAMRTPCTTRSRKTECGN
jgi:hypothetical protein